MFLNPILLQTSNTYLVFGGITETEGILFLGILLIALTIGIRWFLKKPEANSNTKTNKKEA
jgi:hypothetical protein